jgi:hypothetical protein
MQHCSVMPAQRFVMLALKSVKSITWITARDALKLAADVQKSAVLWRNNLPDPIA